MNHCSSGSVSDCQCLNGQGKALSMAGIESHLLVGGALGNRKVLILKAFHIIVSTRRINNWGGGGSGLGLFLLIVFLILNQCK